MTSTSVVLVLRAFFFSRRSTWLVQLCFDGASQAFLNDFFFPFLFLLPTCASGEEEDEGMDIPP